MKTDTEILFNKTDIKLFNKVKKECFASEDYNVPFTPFILKCIEQARAEGKKEGIAESKKKEYDLSGYKSGKSAKIFYQTVVKKAEQQAVADFKARLLSKEVFEKLKGDKWFCFYESEIKEALQIALAESEKL